MIAWAFEMYTQIFFATGDYLVSEIGRKQRGQMRAEHLAKLRGFCRPWYHCAPTGTNSSLGLEPDYKFFQVSRRNQAEILQKCFV